MALTILARPIVGVLFERGAFGPQDAAGTAAALAGLAVGLPFAVAGKILAQTFFARHDVAAPVVAGVAGIGAAVLVAFLLSGRFGILGIGLGISLGFAVHAGVLTVRLHPAGLWQPDRRLKARMTRIAGASLAMGLCLYVAAAAVEGAFGTVLPPGLAATLLIGFCVGGLLLYGIAAWLFGAIGSGRSERRLP